MASRRTSEELIFDGKVTVNGSVCTTPQVKTNPFFVMGEEGDVIKKC